MHAESHLRLVGVLQVSDDRTGRSLPLTVVRSTLAAGHAPGSPLLTLLDQHGAAGRSRRSCKGSGCSSTSTRRPTRPAAPQQACGLRDVARRGRRHGDPRHQPGQAGARRRSSTTSTSSVHPAVRHRPRRGRGVRGVAGEEDLRQATWASCARRSSSTPTASSNRPGTRSARRTRREAARSARA